MLARYEDNRNGRITCKKVRRHGTAPVRHIERAILEQALERGTVDQGLYWQNNEDASGYAAGGFTVLESGETDDGRTCREVLIETAMERRPTDQRVRTYCHDATGWSEATGTGE